MRIKIKRTRLSRMKKPSSINKKIYKYMNISKL